MVWLKYRVCFISITFGRLPFKLHKFYLVMLEGLLMYVILNTYATQLLKFNNKGGVNNWAFEAVSGNVLLRLGIVCETEIFSNLNKKQISNKGEMLKCGNKQEKTLFPCCWRP